MAFVVALLALGCGGAPAIAEGPPATTAAMTPREATPASPPAARPAPSLPDAAASWPSCTEERSCSERWVETRAGFINRWWVSGPLKDRTARKTSDPTKLAAHVTGKGGVLTFNNPVGQLAPSKRLRKRAARPVYLLQAMVHAEQPAEAVFHVGATGKAAVILNGDNIWTTESDQRTLPDHRYVPVTLRRGNNSIVVRLETISPYQVSWSLRVRGPDGRPVGGLSFGLPAGTPAAGGDSDAVCDAVTTKLTPGFDGPPRRGPVTWTVKAEVTAVGLLPRQLGALTLRSGQRVLGDIPSPLSALANDTLTLTGTSQGREPVTLWMGDVQCASWAPPKRHADVQRYAIAAGKLTELGALNEGDAASVEYLLQTTRRAIVDGNADASRVKDLLTQLEQVAAAVSDERSPYANLTGVVQRAYRSRMDGSLQPYVMSIPKTYTRRGKSMPLVLLSHGLWYTPEDMLRIATGHPTRAGASRNEGLQFRHRNSRALLVAHDGYGNAGHRPPGQVDALRVIEEVKASYHVDHRRVSMTGFSLGGSAAFWVPLHNPHTFSATAPLCGYPNIEQYSSVRYAQKEPWEKTLLLQEGIANYAEAGRYLPMKVVHGSRDSPKRSELMVNRYNELGYKVDFDLREGMGHNIWDVAYEDGTLLKWMTRRKRPSRASRPHLRTLSYRHNQAFWLRLDRFDTPGTFAELKGTIRGDKLIVSTDNADGFTLVASELGDAPEAGWKLTIDRTPVGTFRADRDTRFVRRDRRWVVAAGEPDDGHKRHGVSGPLRDLWYAPFIVVYGTSDPLQLEANRTTAEAVARYSDWVNLAMPVFADHEVTEHQLRNTSVVLIGNPRSNRVLSKVADQLPFRFDDDALHFGGRSYRGEEVGISTVRPSPFNPDRYLVVHAGVGARGTLSARYLPEYLPDFLIYDGRLRDMWWDRILSKRNVLRGGFYQSDWSVPGG